MCLLTQCGRALGGRLAAPLRVAAHGVYRALLQIGGMVKAGVPVERARVRVCRAAM